MIKAKNIKKDKNVKELSRKIEREHKSKEQ